MGCIIPKAVILFQWYEPLKRFIMMKRLEMDCLTPRMQINPFSLVFSSAASNCDFPLVRLNISNNIFKICIGVYRNEVNASEFDIREAKKQKFNLQFVDFNDTGKMEHFLSRTGTNSLAETLLFESPTETIRPSWYNKQRLEVVAMKQLDRDTLFIAFEDQV